MSKVKHNNIKEKLYAEKKEISTKWINTFVRGPKPSSKSLAEK